jgi:2-polyprenyl-3-methyl-5-hydroxy-6-metoxy-1,4-benzoquinol methylase
MRSKGWDCEGIDFDAKAIERAKSVYGLKARCGAISDFDFPENHFDAITLKHVIEHLPKPVDDIRHCWRLLKPGGQLVVATPNSHSMGHQIFKESWMNLDPPRHLFIFSPPTLARVAALAGFNRFRTITTAANADTMFAVSLAVRSRGSHEMGHHKRPEIFRAINACKLQFSEVSALKRDPTLGEELVLIAQK